MMLPAEFNPDFPGLAEALASTPPSVSLRLNRSKADVEVIGGERVPWCDAGRYLSVRPEFTFDPAMHQGVYYVQDASSMIYSHIASHIAGLTGNRPLVALDACAAPGGKTTAMIDVLPQGSLMVANEYVAARAEVLHENLVKWGSPDVVVSRGDTARFSALAGMFDLIAADVPCSGEGMFRKDAQAVGQWSPSLVGSCAALQRDIVANLWPALAPGGYMIYSTCTFNRAENEDNVAWMLDNLPGAVLIDIPADDSWNLTRRDGTLHFLPGQVRGEGLTVALLHKSMEYGQQPLRLKKTKTSRPVAVAADARKWIDAADFDIVADGDDLYARRRCWMPHMDALSARLTLPWGAGVNIATVKGRDLIPSQALAMSTLLSTGAFNTTEVGYAQAIAYLRRESLTLPADVARGLILLTYAGRPLGFVKNLGNRANNLYPQPWRILSTHAPQQPPFSL